MDNYQYKYSKYRNKYDNLKKIAKNEDKLTTMLLAKGAGNTIKERNGSDVVTIDNLVVYPNQSLVKTKITTDDNIHIINGLVEDSIIFYKLDGNVGQSIILNDRNSQKDKLSKNNQITVIDEDGLEIKGTIDSVDAKLIKLIKDDGQMVIIKKWKQATIPSVRHPRPTFQITEPGTLQYLINNINWQILYHLRLDSDDLETASGTFYCLARVNNSTGHDIDVDKLVLITGNLKTEESDNTRMYSAMASKRYGINDELPDQGTISELISYPIGAWTIAGDIMMIPLMKINLENITKIYFFNVTVSTTNSKKQFMESSYGYKIPITDKDLPAGLLRIFAKSIDLDTTITLGSVNIGRTPKNTTMEVILGNTSRVRGNITKQVSKTSMRSGMIDKQDYIITDVSINATIINDTGKKQETQIKDYVDDSTIISSNGKPINKMGYLIWTVFADPGETTINYKYQLRS